MKDFKLYKQGAEARLHLGVYLDRPAIAKERFEKKYRNPHLDIHLTKERMKAECRAIVRCKSCGIRTPCLYYVDFAKRTIFMEYFEHSLTVKDFVLRGATDEQIDDLSKSIGLMLGKMHDNNIIHGDLTTSNLLLVNKNAEDKFDELKDLDVVIIDFGLARMENNTEDKGVDLYVLERAIASTHSQGEAMFKGILKGYKQAFKSNLKEVMSKYEDVRARGRKRTMVG